MADARPVGIERALWEWAESVQGTADNPAAIDVSFMLRNLAEMGLVENDGEEFWVSPVGWMSLIALLTLVGLDSRSYSEQLPDIPQEVPWPAAVRWAMVRSAMEYQAMVMGADPG